MSNDSNTPGPPPDLPNAEEIRVSLTSNSEERRSLEQSYRQEFSDLAMEAEERFAHLEGLVDHYKHKGNWSWFLMGVIGFLVGFQLLLLVLVGAGTWDFSKYPYLIPALLVQNFAAILGLAQFVVRSLFTHLR